MQKGIAFSLLAILLLTPLVVLSINYSKSLRGYGQLIGEQIRIQSGYYFMQSMEQDLVRAGEIIGKRSLVAATDFVIRNGTGLDNATKRLEELFVNGTIYGNVSAVLVNSTIIDWLDRIEDIGAKSGFLIKMELKTFSVRMHDSWNVEFDVGYTISLQDVRGTFGVTKDAEIKSIVSIIGLEDPIFPLNTYGKVTRTIKQSPFSIYTEKLDDMWNTSNLLSFLENGYYHAGDGPSFIDRLEGKFTNTWPGSGIESFVRKDEISNAGVPVKIKRSNIDHVYFVADVPAYRVNNTLANPDMPESFRIDNETCGVQTHAQIYQLTDIIY